MKSEISWEDLKAILSIGDVVVGVVQKHEAFGIFVDMGYNFFGLIQITDFKDEGVMTPEEYPAIGEEVKAKVLGFKDSGHQIWLGVKPSQLS